MQVNKETVCLVTGASRGIGVHIVQEFSKRGCRFVLAARDHKGLEKTAALAQKAGCEALIVPGDLGDTPSLIALVQEATNHFGRIDLLINNAGVEGNYFFQDAPLDRLEWTLRININAPMALSRLVLPGMLERNHGHILNIASLAGLGPTAFGEAYGASKHAMIGFTSAMRASLQTQASAVSASALCPGYVSDVGMFADKITNAPNAKAPAFLGTSSPKEVAQAALKAVEKDLPNLIVNSGPLRLSLALSLIFPRFGEWLGHFLGVHASGHEAAKSEREQSA
jgi:short-subunit dehydrogenase